MNSTISFEDEQGTFFDVQGETDEYLVHIWKDTNEAFCNCPSFILGKLNANTSNIVERS